MRFSHLLGFGTALSLLCLSVHLFPSDFQHIFLLLVRDSGFVIGVSCLLNRLPSRSKNNSLTAGVVSSQLSDASAVVASTAPGSFLSSSADSICEAVVRAIGSLLSMVLSSIQVNASSWQASNSSASTVALNAVFHHSPTRLWLFSCLLRAHRYQWLV